MVHFTRCPKAQRGLTLVSLLFYAILFAGVSGVYLAGPSVLKYIELRALAKQLAREALNTDPGRHEMLIQTFLTDAFKTTDLVLYRSHVIYRNRGSRALEVEIAAKFPVILPFIDKRYDHPVTIQVVAKKD